MLNRIFSALVILAVSAVSSYGQLEEKMNDEGVVAGAIIKDGKKTEGFIRALHLVCDNDKIFPAPWRFQDDISFISKEEFIELEKVKNKNYEKYKAKHLDGYHYGTLVFESVKYADLSAVGTGMIPRKMFMRKLHQGAISLYHHFQTPPSIVSGSFQPYYIECAKPALVYRKGDDGKLKLLNGLNIEKELADCATVVEKHKNGEYNLASDNESKLVKLVSSVIFRDDVRLLAIADYNSNCE